jgi:hypothetical protein
LRVVVVGQPTRARACVGPARSHHGNGSEAIIRNLVPHEERVPVPGGYPPISFKSHKPWLDETDVRPPRGGIHARCHVRPYQTSEVLFSSIHLLHHEPGRHEFYPGTGAGHGCDLLTSGDDIAVPGVLNIPLKLVRQDGKVIDEKVRGCRCA